MVCRRGKGATHPPPPATKTRGNPSPLRCLRPTESRIPSLERIIRPRERPPHMRARTVVVAEPFFRLLEMAADDVLERVDRHLGVRIERVEVVHGDEPRL